MSNSNIDDLFPCISCGVNADPADGFGKCTCGNEAKREAIQQELLKAKWEIVNMAKQRAEDDDVYTLQAFAEDMDTYLQAKLKGDDK